MKFLQTCKDGGPRSTVWAHVLIELKAWFSIMLLRFEDGSREAYHSHAFTSISWVLSGGLVECHGDGRVQLHLPSFLPVITYRSTLHKVVSSGRTWVLTFRGPWADRWFEVVNGEVVTLTHGRVRVEDEDQEPETLRSVAPGPEGPSESAEPAEPQC